MNWEIVIVCGLASVLLIGGMRLLAWVERREEIRSKAERDCQRSAMKLAGQDKQRPLDIWI